MEPGQLDLIADACSQRVCDRLEPKLAPLQDIPFRVKALEKANEEKTQHRWKINVAVIAAVVGPLATWFVEKVL